LDNEPYPTAFIYGCSNDVPTEPTIAVNKLRKLSASEEIRERMRKEEKTQMDRIFCG